MGSAHVCLLMFVISILEQPNNLQWALALVPLIKALQLGLSFLFWYVIDLLPVTDELLIAVEDVFDICFLYCLVYFLHIPIACG